MSDLIQIRFDYTALTTEQAQRTQDAEVRIIGRTQRTIVENGRDLLAVKQDIGHGNFLNWTQSLGISSDTAEKWMNVAKNFNQIPTGAEFTEKALALLSTSKVLESARDEAKERAADGEKITEDIARQIRDAHRARELAEQQAQQAQQQLDLFKQEAESDVEALAKAHEEEKTRLNQLIEYIKAEKEQIAQSKVQTLVEDTPETIAKVQDLASKLKELSDQQKKLLSAKKDKEDQLQQKIQRIKELTEAIQEYANIDQQTKHYEQIRNKWRQACDAFHAGINQGFARMVTPLDAQQAFESDDWARLAELENTFRDSLKKIADLRQSAMGQFVDASMDYVEA